MHASHKAGMLTRRAGARDARGLGPEVDGNWRLVGNDWDPALHEKAVEAVRSGKIVLDENDGSSRELCTKVVTEADLEAI